MLLLLHLYGSSKPVCGIAVRITVIEICNCAVTDVTTRTRHEHQLHGTCHVASFVLCRELGGAWTAAWLLHVKLRDLTSIMSKASSIQSLLGPLVRADLRGRVAACSLRRHVLVELPELPARHKPTI